MAPNIGISSLNGWSILKLLSGQSEVEVQFKCGNWGRVQVWISLPSPAVRISVYAVQHNNSNHFIQALKAKYPACDLWKLQSSCTNLVTSSWWTSPLWRMKHCQHVCSQIWGRKITCWFIHLSQNGEMRIPRLCYSSGGREWEAKQYSCRPCICTFSRKLHRQGQAIFTLHKFCWKHTFLE